MNHVMLVSFMDELEKISANAALVGLTPPTVAKPPSLTHGATVKANTKPTNYAPMHSQITGSAVGTADSSKAVPPPSVRT